MAERCYKVVRPVGRQLVSVLARQLAPRLAVKYPPGKWVRAKLGGLFCYRTPHGAYEFSYSLMSEDLQMWEAEGKDRMELPPGIPGREYRAERFWKDIAAGRVDHGQVVPLLGRHEVLLFRQVRLVRRMMPDEIRELVQYDLRWKWIYA